MTRRRARRERIARNAYRRAGRHWFVSWRRWLRARRAAHVALTEAAVNDWIRTLSPNAQTIARTRMTYLPTPRFEIEVEP